MVIYAAFKNTRKLLIWKKKTSLLYLTVLFFFILSEMPRREMESDILCLGLTGFVKTRLQSEYHIWMTRINFLSGNSDSIDFLCEHSDSIDFLCEKRDSITVWI